MTVGLDRQDWDFPSTALTSKRLVKVPWVTTHYQQRKFFEVNRGQPCDEHGHRI